MVYGSDDVNLARFVWFSRKDQRAPRNARPLLIAASCDDARQLQGHGQALTQIAVGWLGPSRTALDKGGTRVFQPFFKAVAAHG
eukprot:10538807-Lingulodinium_polyedra.AAC.1